MVSNEIKLKLCPFCGGKAYLEWCKGYLYMVECEQCHATTARYIAPEEAEDAWNERAEA